MAFRLELGQYYRTNSPIHRLDARVKIIAMIVCMVAFFCISTPPHLLIGLGFAGAVLALSHIPPRHILRSIAPILLLLCFIALFNLLIVQTGIEVLHFGILRITTDGIWSAIIYACRFGCAIALGSLLLLTTTPTQLSDAFDMLLAPLGRLGLPSHEIAMVFALMMRFVPLLAEEMSDLLDAQALRGARFDEGSLIKRLKALLPLIVALFAGGIRHARGLARALEARCYDSGAHRTHYHQARCGLLELVTLLVSTTFMLLIIFLP